MPRLEGLVLNHQGLLFTHSIINLTYELRSTISHHMLHIHSRNRFAGMARYLFIEFAYNIYG